MARSTSACVALTCLLACTRGQDGDGDQSGRPGVDSAGDAVPNDDCEDRLVLVDGANAERRFHEIGPALPLHADMLAAADLDGDGVDEIVIGTSSLFSIAFVVWPGEDRITSAELIDGGELNRIASFETADLDGDGREAVLFPGSDGDVWSLELGVDDGLRVRAIDMGELRDGDTNTAIYANGDSRLTFADLDGDGRDDGLFEQLNISNQAWSGVAYGINDGNDLSPWRLGTVEKVVRNPLLGEATSASWYPAAQPFEHDVGGVRHLWWWMSVGGTTWTGNADGERPRPFAWRVPAPVGTTPSFAQGQAVPLPEDLWLDLPMLVPFGDAGEVGLLACCGPGLLAERGAAWAALDTAGSGAPLEWFPVSDAIQLEAWTQPRLADVDGDGDLDVVALGRAQGSYSGPDALLVARTGIAGVDSLSPDYRSDELLLGVTVAQLSAGDAPTVVAFERVCAGDPTFDGI